MFLPLHSEIRMANILLSLMEVNMKKLFFMLVLLFCVTSLFGQDLFTLARIGTPEQVQAAINAGEKIDDRDEDGFTPLIYAAALNENPDVITTLLNAGAKIDDYNKDGMTPLMYAAFSNENLDVISTLVNAGANIHNRNKNGWTPLMLAAIQNQNPDVITALLKAGAKVNDRTEDGFTPLMFAAFSNKNPDVISTLVNAGAKIDDRDEGGMTPLMLAAIQNQNPDVITALLKAGADASLKSKANKTALDYAQDNNAIKGTSAYAELKKATLAANTPVTSQPSIDSWVSTSFGSYRVERMWEESRYTYVLVSYRNTTSRTFNDIVTITAFLYDANNCMLDMEDKSFYAFENGPMSPGFEGTLKFSFSLVGAKRVEIRIGGY